MITTEMNGSGKAKRGGKAELAKEAFARMLADLSRRGYYGSVSLTLSVQDGHIQNVRIATDQLVR